MSQPDKGTKFVVLSSQRSGTTWLMSLLNQLPATHAYGELFLKRKKTGSSEIWDEQLNLPHFPETYPRGKKLLRLPLVFSYLDKLYRQPGAVGFKLMYTQIQKYPEIALYMFIHRIKIVHLVRKNQLDVLISREVKNKLHRAHVVNTSSVPGEVKVEINPQRLMVRLKRRYKNILAARRILRWSTLPNIEVYYEDLLSDGLLSGSKSGSNPFQQLCAFLHVEMGDQMPESKLVKIGGKGHTEVVSNYQEIQNALTGTLFAGWVEHPDKLNGNHKQEMR